MDDTSHRDDIYATQHADVGEFIFDKKVVDVFPDMIKRSVPGYSTIIHMIGQMAERYAKADSTCYDLGCSLGAATLAMRHRISAAGVKIVGVDNSSDMIERAKQVIDADSYDVPVTLCCEDINQTPITNASVVVLNFTLQFIPKEQRQSLLANIYAGMNPGGILILSEKLAFEDEHHDELVTDLHHYFKKTNGYSDLEIAQKRSAIENVLVPETIATHKNRLTEVGFRSVDLWFQCFNFASIVAFK